MKMFLLEKLTQKKINFFIRYCVIGFLSIAIELLIRNFLLSINVNAAISLFLPLVIGITFAFISNVTFNFRIPRYYYKKSFIYFSII